MDLTSRLLIFLEVVEQGSFIKAAELRNIDRSIVSKQMTKLERDLGVRLLNRTTRSFSLTAAGAEMVKKATELRFILQETVTLAENYHSEPKGVLKIAAAPLIGRRYLQPVINDFQIRYPQVEVELRLDSRVSDVVSEGVDIAFRVGEPKDASFVARKLARNRVIIAASPKFLDTFGKPNNLNDLTDLPAATFVSSTKRVQSLQYLNEAGEHCEHQLKSVYKANDGEVLIMKVLSGTAYFAGPSFIINKEILNGELVPILTNTKLVEYSGMYAVYPHRDLPVRTRLFFDAVRDYIGHEKPRWEETIPNFDNMYR